jgi:transcriptional regulator with XRE-family HTH domain
VEFGGKVEGNPHMANSLALTIRAKKLGVLMRDARLAAGKTIEECARAVGVDAEAYEEYEMGEKSPSLPELEVLAYTLRVPLGQFWSDKTFSTGSGEPAKANMEQLVALRQRIVGAVLRQARLDAGLSLQTLAERAWVSPEALEAYELGEQPVPLPDLEVLSSVLDRPLSDFQDRHGPVGAWASQQKAIEGFMALPPELQAFVSRPVNQPYLLVAKRLSEMSAERLRGIAEGLLEITY